MTPFASLISGFASSVGIPKMAPDKDGMLRFRIGDSLDMAVSHSPSTDLVTAYAIVGKLPEDDSNTSSLLSELLEANLFWRRTNGATLALRNPGGWILLSRREPLSGLDSSNFESLLRELIQAAEFWQAHITTWNRPPEPLESEAPRIGSMISA